MTAMGEKYNRYGFRVDPKADKLINSNLNQPEDVKNVPLSDNSNDADTHQDNMLSIISSVGDLPISSLPDID